MLVARVGDRPAHVGARREGALHLDAEPGTELRGVGEGAPHPGARRAQQDLSLDAVRAGWVHMQPPGCMLGLRESRCNRKVAFPHVHAAVTWGRRPGAYSLGRGPR